MPNYAAHLSTKITPQTSPIPGKAMVANSAGGFSFALDMWKRLDRFLVLGSAGGSYYATEKKLTVENAGVIAECLASDARRTVARIVAVSEGGLAPKNDPAIFALSLCACGSEEAKQLAYAALPRVARIGTHLFQFAAACNEMRGWGRGLRRAISRWYVDRDPADLAYQVAKYQSREGWSHRDLLRLAHVRALDMPPSYSLEKRQSLEVVLRWVVRGGNGLGDVRFERHHKAGETVTKVPAHYSGVRALPEFLAAFEAVKNSTDAAFVAEKIRQHNLPRECVPTGLLTQPAIWEALLEKMPLTAMIRNLGNMSKSGLLTPLSEAARKVATSLRDGALLKKARIHPLAILIATKTYAQGHGMKGSGEWQPVQGVVDALNDAFYLAFDAVEPTGKRWLFGIDVSGSMSSPCAGSPVSCCEAATALALVTNRVETQTFLGRFNCGFEPLPFGRATRLDEALRHTRAINGGGTDCAMPMVYAMKNHLKVDTFCVLTDNETYAGQIHPVQALKQYRDQTGIPAKLIVVGMVSNGFTIADPNDAGMLDVCGFSTDVPAVMADFARE